VRFVDSDQRCMEYVCCPVGATGNRFGMLLPCELSS